MIEWTHFGSHGPQVDEEVAFFSNDVAEKQGGLSGYLLYGNVLQVDEDLVLVTCTGGSPTVVDDINDYDDRDAAKDGHASAMAEIEEAKGATFDVRDMSLFSSRAIDQGAHLL